MKQPKRIASYLSFALCALLSLESQAGNCPTTPYNGVYTEPTYGQAVIDGSTNEWDLYHDFFVHTYVAGDTNKDTLGNVYLRYDCSNQVMNVLVLNYANTYPCLVDTVDAWGTVSGIGGKVYDGSATGPQPNFHWVGVGFDGNQNHCLGYEASFSIAPGNYLMEFHVEVDYNGGATSGTPGHPCPQVGVAISVGPCVFTPGTGTGGGGDNDPGTPGNPPDTNNPPSIVTNTPPDISCPIDMTIQYGDSIDPTNTGVATSTTGSISYSDSTNANYSCPTNMIVSRTWTATDSSTSLTSTCTQQITVLLECPPSLTCPSNLVVEAGSDTSTNSGGVASTDGVSLSYSDTTVSGGECPTVQTITRTWTASSVHGVLSTCSQVITVQDTSAPSITVSNGTIQIFPTDTCTPTLNFSATVADTGDAAPTITYNPPQGSLLHPGTNVITVVATDHCGNSATNFYNVVVYTLIYGTKFYDSNADGVQENNEPGIPGWKIQLYTTANVLVAQTVTDANGKYQFANLLPGNYVVKEVVPTTGGWVSTTPSVYTITNLTCPLDPPFGAVCVGTCGGGGLTIGYWGNKNGQNSMTTTGGGMAANIAFLVGLNLRDAKGNSYDPSSYSDYAKWLGSATANNMAYMLSAQLSSLELTTRLKPVKDQSGAIVGGVNGSSLIYAKGANSANPAGFATVSALMTEANTELGLHGLTVTSSTTRTYQNTLQTIINSANNNQNFVCSGPSPVVYP